MGGEGLCFFEVEEGSSGDLIYVLLKREVVVKDDSVTLLPLCGVAERVELYMVRQNLLVVLRRDLGLMMTLAVSEITHSFPTPQSLHRESNIMDYIWSSSAEISKPFWTLLRRCLLRHCCRTVETSYSTSVLVVVIHNGYSII